MNRTRIIGITGGIGSGKSSVSRLLAAYCNVPLIDVDQCCRRLLMKGERGWQALRDNFGPDLFDQDGELIRSTLRELIFNNEQMRAKVDDLLHPLAREEMDRQVEGLDSALVIAEIPLLYEAGWQGDVDAVVLVYAEKEMQYERIVSRDLVRREAAMAAVASQMDLKEKTAMADYVIDNSFSWVETRERVISVAVQLEKEVGEVTFSQK